MYDVLITNGTIVDGTGKPAFRGEVAIKGGRIAKIVNTERAERLDQGAAEIIDANGALVTPGWVDTHSHMDGQATWDPYCSPANYHGITTLVMGNCGIGFAPCVRSEEAHQQLIEVVEDVEDIPGTALAEGLTWNWESFPEYLDALDRMPRAVNIAAQVPHCAIRTYVMGERGANNERATPEDVTRMADLVAEGIEAGAVGFTTSRTELHKTRNGLSMPGTYSEQDELFGIGRKLGELGKGFYGMVSDWEDDAWREEMEWMKRLSIENNCRFNFVLFYQTEEQWRRVQEQLDFVARANREGAQLVAHVGARPVNVLMSYHGTVHPFFLHQNFAPLVGLSPEERIERLKDPAVRAAILAEPTPSLGIEVADRMMTDFDLMFELGEHPNYEQPADQSIAAKAAAKGVTPQEYAYDALLERDGQAMLYFPFMGYDQSNLDRQLEMMRNDNAVISLADTGAHCGVLCDASMPTFLLTHYVRDRAGETLGLEEAVKMHTHDTARVVSMEDRGTLEPGMRADINVIDFNALTLHAPEVIYDLPAGGKRIVQKATGYRYTLVAGEVIMKDGVATNAMPGSLVRGAQPAPGIAA
ncbi:amidohydrolase family protein [Halieaceae bacterium]|nr:amidohydrolase family protein [Halieaceae bacterium]